MEQTQQSQETGKRTWDRTRLVWLGLISLTLLSAAVGESGRPSLVAIVIVCSVTLMKGRWIIQDFMGLRNAAPLTRRLVTGYFLAMTSMVGISLGYLQFTATQ
ncbi:cytochrome C oxidase subunit IV family protein [Marinobacter subterrani]|uniref:Prokaryotic Cytochrome C oxidase subunit IV n=1 Tax=Marinobacter subterrani TaxID=1658765 RepID=A0A0J7JDH2_9GAMM|nr:cytochrome C oxidase subunit IV family protein [Marinobacter subterrani]KMQ76142.1 Prokaryotic Cytochrome C oxidase subunit IV [Marinobacter subterrani]